MNILVIVLCGCLIPAIVACNGKKMKSSRESPPINYIKNYEFSPKISRFCDTLRSDKQSFRFSEESSNGNCDNLVHGLEKLQHGITKFHFMQQSNDYETTHDKNFHFTCDDNLDAKLSYFQGKIVPPEVKTFHATPTISRSHHDLSRMNIFATLEKDFDLLEPSHLYLSELAAMDFKLNDEHSTDYLAVNVNHYNVQLKSGIEPTREILADFNSLPNLTPETILQYYHFILSYGTHLHLGTYLGGDLRVLRSSAKHKGKEHANSKMDDKTHTTTMNEVLAMPIGTNKNTAIFATGGLFAKEVEGWVNSVQNYPVPKTYNFMPIHLFLSKGVSSNITKSLEKMEKFEENHNFLKRTNFQLSLLKIKHNLADFISDNIKAETQYICPSDEVVFAAKTGITNANNVDMKKFFVQCRIFKESDTEVLTENRFFTCYLACVQMFWSLPCKLVTYWCTSFLKKKFA